MTQKMPTTTSYPCLTEAALAPGDAYLPTAGIVAMADEAIPRHPRRVLQLRGDGQARHTVTGLSPPLQLMRARNLAELLRAQLIDARTTVAFDLDQTLITTDEDADDLFDDSIMSKTVCIEPTTAKIVRGLQDAGVPVFGLTARGPSCGPFNIPARTATQLRSLHIDLNLSEALPTRSLLPLRYPSCCQYGIAFCGNNPKGTVLAHLARQQPWRRLVVVDDNLSNFSSLAALRHVCDLDLSWVYYTKGLSDRDIRHDRWRWWWQQAWLHLA